MISVSNSLGKKLEANYFLYFNLLSFYTNKNYIFDFEGSEIPGIAAFYQKFNPEKEIYNEVKINNLTKIIRLLKN